MPRKTVTGQYRAIRADIKATDIPGRIEGTAIVFNRYSVPIYDWCSPTCEEFNEVIQPDALKNCDLSDVRLLVNHNEAMIPLARTKAKGRDLANLEISIDETGLHIATNLDIDNSATAKELYSAVKNGVMRGMSFAFTIPEGGDSWEVSKDSQTHIIREIDKIYEVSVVSEPAYPDTSISARYARSLDNDKKALEKVRAQNTLEILKLRFKIKTH